MRLFATLLLFGEAARHVLNEISAKYPDIPWRVMEDIRNFVPHEYWDVELSTLWKTIQDDRTPLVCPPFTTG